MWTVPTQKKISLWARMWSFHLLGNLRLLREKRIRKGFCNETKAAKSGHYRCHSPSDKALLLLESEKEGGETFIWHLLCIRYLF